MVGRCLEEMKGAVSFALPVISIVIRTTGDSHHVEVTLQESQKL